MTIRVPCVRCHRQILETTAGRHHGLCAICKRDQDVADFEGVVQKWIDNPALLPGTNGIPMPDNIALRIAAGQIKARLYPAPDDHMEQTCHKHFEEAHEKWLRHGSAGLTKDQRIVLAIETFLGEVTNGGLEQYLGNESGAFAGWAAAAFDEIGIPAYGDVMRDAQRLFPQDVIPEDPFERGSQVDSIDADMLETAERSFWQRYFTDEKEIRRKLFQHLIRSHRG